MSGRSRTSPWLPWLLLGPAFLAAGALLGGNLSPARIWTEPAPVPSFDETRQVGIPSLAPIVRAVRSGVVGVRTVRRGADRLDDSVDPGSTFEREVNGSGFILHESGLVVTNHHLVVDHQEILVEVPGCPAVEAELVGDDPVTDIAVLRFEPPPGGIMALTLGDSTRIQQGDWVLAFGNPFEYSETVTVGIVSYVGRHIPEEGMLVSNEYLQFSAPVFPGSSGGPVFDMRGHVVGVTKSSDATATGTGISFAVPSKVLKLVLQRMNESEGRVQRGFLGLRLLPVDAASSRPLGIEPGRGALVARVETGRPAEVAGLRAGDVVVTYNGQPVTDVYTLFDWITYSRPGDRAELEVIRSGARLPPMIARLAEVEYRDAEPGPPVRVNTSH